MKTIKFLVPVICIGLIALSCSKSSSPAPVSATDAKADLNASSNKLSTELTSVAQTPGYTALNSFSTFTSGSGITPFGRIASFKQEQIAPQLKIALMNVHTMMVNSTSSNARVSGNTPFNYNDKKGIYTYNFGTGKFDYSSASSIVEIKYPSDSTKTTNNADFQLTAYSETQLSDGSYTATNVQASVTVDGTPQASIKFTAQYSGDSPNLVSLALFLNPYTWTLDFDDTKSTSTSESFSLSKSGTLLIGTGGTVSYATSNDKAASNPSSASGYLQLVDVRFSITTNTSNPNADPNDPNTFIFITVTINGGSAGKVVFVANNGGGYDPYVQYNDGTQDPLQTLFQSLGDQLQTLFS